jgi:excisionase family DNA binding protein
MANEIPFLLTQSEAADYLRLSKRSLERWRVTGDGPAYCKAGRRVLYREADLEAWIASRVVHSTSEETGR